MSQKRETAHAGTQAVSGHTAQRGEDSAEGRAVSIRFVEAEIADSAELAELRKDKARLDWLEKHGAHNGPYQAMCEGDTDSWWELPSDPVREDRGTAYATMRDALDVAMSPNAHATRPTAAV